MEKEDDDYREMKGKIINKKDEEEVNEEMEEKGGKDFGEYMIKNEDVGRKYVE